MRLKRLWPGKRTFGYVAVLAASYFLALFAGWTAIGAQIDDYFYDFLLRLNPPAPIHSRGVIVALDDASFAEGGVRQERTILAQTLERVAAAKPKAVAVDIILHDRQDRAEDDRLAGALRQIPNLVLATDKSRDGWEDPRPEFLHTGVALGHAIADQSHRDGVTRAIPLEQIGFRQRRWAIALEAFKFAKGVPDPQESPADVRVGDTLIPAPGQGQRQLRIRYAPGALQIPAGDLGKPQVAAQLKDKVVFVGITSLSFTRDRVTPPDGIQLSGVEVHLQAFETMERGQFLTDASHITEIVGCALVVALAGCIFAFLEGWPAYLLGALLLFGTHATPYLAFRSGTVLPYVTLLASAWLSVAAAASYQSFVVRRQLRKSETERTRYRQAIHFVTHEMRSPLTAIQGSSELISRYAMNDEKRRQIATMINSESKRLARMIQTFLDVERLSDGQMELKREPFSVNELVDSCAVRVRPLADRKSIRLTVEAPVEGELVGDRELMEYAVYNLLTNAVKYSPAETEVHVSSHSEGDLLRLSVRDQGMGMDAKELKQIFQRFYRTKRAEASGEVGTGIGLSIVEQIVTHHGGRMEVTSAPGKGSCFTVVLPQKV